MPGMEHPAARPPLRLDGPAANLAGDQAWSTIYVGDDPVRAQAVADENPRAQIEGHDGFLFVFVPTGDL